MKDPEKCVEEYEDQQLEEFRKFVEYWGFSSQALTEYLQEPKGTECWRAKREKALFVWSNYKHRLVKTQPRKLHVNLKLCCPQEVSDGWHLLQEEIVSGVVLIPRLSRKIKLADYNDPFLNDWGFHHFHLGMGPDAMHPRLTAGTNFVLVAVVDDSDFYPVSFVEHGKWDDQSILETAINVFPERFERYRLKGVDDVRLLIPDDAKGNEIGYVRSLNANTFRKIGEHVYFPPGMGIMQSGGSLAAIASLDQNRKEILHIPC